MEPRSYKETEKKNCATLDRISVQGIHQTKWKHVVKARWDRTADMLPHCPQCQKAYPKQESKGWYGPREILDRPMDGGPLIIKIERRGYLCHSCEKTFGSRHPGIIKNSNLTMALVNHIQKYSMTLETHTSIARRTGVGESTVWKCFRQRTRAVKRGRATNWRYPEALGIDGVSIGSGLSGEESGKSEFTTAVVSLDPEGGGFLVELLPDQDSGRLADFLDNGVSPSGDTLSAVIDMDKGYRKALRDSKLPTIPVIDRCHVARRANLAGAAPGQVRTAE
jgi:transposase